MGVRDDIGMRFRPVPADRPPAAGLIAAMEAEINRTYGGDIADGPSATAADFAPPTGTCLIGERDGVAVCVGAVKRLTADTGEIKRMYVAPEARGQGAARALLAALEDAARALGYATVRLDTGSRQPHARALYDSAGYTEIADYNDNPFAAYWGEKAL
jgi:GNAT superfamily N-acetyltransferase